VLLVFASGFLLGRVGSVVPTQPVVRALPGAKPIPLEDEIRGSLAYLYSSREQLATLAEHDLFSGVLEPRARVSLPPGIEPGPDVSTKLASFGRSVAITVLAGEEGHVAFSPHGRAVHAWVPGIEAAWLSESELLIRESDGSVRRWTSEAERVTSRGVGDADELIQSPGGPVVRRGRTIEAFAPSRRTLRLPPGAEVLAVAPDTTRVVLGGSTPALWDGTSKTPIRSGTGRVIAASFAASSDQVALVHRTEDGLIVAVSDMRGDAALKPISSKANCATPSWDRFGAWVYVASSDGMLHAVEAAGGRIRSVEIHSVGCGAAWVDAP
jgi:hypothetical protein